MLGKINVLDRGYVILHEVMGDDLTTVNAARVSFNKKKEQLDEKDQRLIRFLAREGHTSPFRHSFLQFEVYAPLMVARQWWKYVVGSDHIMDAWNESSRRYVTEEPEFYIPAYNEWRSAPTDRKQGSGEPVDVKLGTKLTLSLMGHVKRSVELYEEALAAGVCAEQARLYLPAYGLFVRWYWSASLLSVAHLLNQRLAKDAQQEFSHYAAAVYKLAEPHFPYSLAELVRRDLIGGGQTENRDV